MRLLLDTHIALWAISDDPKLPETARGLIADAANEVVISVVSIWEIAIKHALRRARHDAVAVSGGEASRLFGEAGYLTLPITTAHAAAIDALPSHHGDPFDRMLVAQAVSEPLRLLTRDAVLTAYGEMVIVV